MEKRSLETTEELWTKENLLNLGMANEIEVTEEMSEEPTVTRDALWKLLPGMLIYNLIGRYVIWLRARRYGAPLPSWITIAEMRAIPFRRNQP